MSKKTQTEPKPRKPIIPPSPKPAAPRVKIEIGKPSNPTASPTPGALTVLLILLLLTFASNVLAQIIPPGSSSGSSSTYTNRLLTVLNGTTTTNRIWYTNSARAFGNTNAIHVLTNSSTVKWEWHTNFTGVAATNDLNRPTGTWHSVVSGALYGTTRYDGITASVIPTSTPGSSAPSPDLVQVTNNSAGADGNVVIKTGSKSKWGELQVNSTNAHTLDGYTAARLAEEPFTIAIFPDSQYLTASHSNTWWSQCAWITNNAAARNIKAVIHVGDVVDDAAVLVQWTNAIAGLNILKAAGLPVIVSVGNHDMDVNPQMRWQTNWNTYLPNSYFSSFPNFNGGFYGPTNWASWLLLTNTPKPYLLLASAWLPDDSTISYLNGIEKTYSNAPAIYAAHVYCDSVAYGRRASWSNPYSVESIFVQGDASAYWTANRQWANWLYNSSSIFAVWSGHLSAPINSIFFSEPARDGHIVTQNLCDYQSDVVPYIELLTIDGARNICHIETINTADGSSLTNWNEQYSFPIFSKADETTSAWQTGLSKVAGGAPLIDLEFNGTNNFTTLDSGPFSLSVTGFVQRLDSGLDNSAFFSTTTNAIKVEDLDLFTGMTNFTVSFWFNKTNAGGTQVVVSKFGSGTDGEWYCGFGGLNNQLLYVHINDAGDRITTNPTASFNVNDGSWHMATFTYDGTNAIGYLDGVFLSETAHSGRTKPTFHPVWIGATGGTSGSATAPANPPLCLVDGLKIWNRSLKIEDIKSEYYSGLSRLQIARTTFNAYSGINVASGAVTNNGLIWFSLATNGVPALAGPDGSFCTTTNGQMFVRSNATWIAK